MQKVDRSGSVFRQGKRDGLRSEITFLPTEDDGVVPGCGRGRRNCKREAAETEFSLLKHAQITLRALIGPAAFAVSGGFVTEPGVGGSGEGDRLCRERFDGKLKVQRAFRHRSGIRRGLETDGEAFRTELSVVLNQQIQRRTGDRHPVSVGDGDAERGCLAAEQNDFAGGGEQRFRFAVDQNRPGLPRESDHPMQGAERDGGGEFHLEFHIEGAGTRGADGFRDRAGGELRRQFRRKFHPVRAGASLAVPPRAVVCRRPVGGELLKKKFRVPDSEGSVRAEGHRLGERRRSERQLEQEQQNGINGCFHRQLLSSGSVTAGHLGRIHSVTGAGEELPDIGRTAPESLSAAFDMPVHERGVRPVLMPEHDAAVFDDVVGGEGLGAAAELFMTLHIAAVGIEDGSGGLPHLPQRVVAAAVDLHAEIP